MQTRWLCKQCSREWLYAHDWDPQTGCPMCRSAQIERVTYRPTFPGSDIPRDGQQALVADPIVVPAQAPSILLQVDAGDDDIWGVPV